MRYKLLILLVLTLTSCKDAMMPLTDEQVAVRVKNCERWEGKKAKLTIYTAGPYVGVVGNVKCINSEE